MMIKHAILFFVLIFLCGNICAENKTGNTTGFVYDRHGNPMANAEISFDDKSLKNIHTDESGFFNFIGPEGKYWATISARGFEKYYHEFEIKANTTIVGDTIFVRDKGSSPAYRESAENEKFDQLIINVGYQQGWRSMGQVSVGICDQRFRFKKITPIWHLRQIHVGTMFVLRKDPILGPKISYDATLDGPGWLSLITYGADAIYYFDSRYSGFYLNPHFGLTAFAFYNVLLGYNIPLQKSEMTNYVNGFHVTLNIPLFKRITKKTLK